MSLCPDRCLTARLGAAGRRFARQVVAAVAALTLVWAPVPADACTQVYLGSDTTASGDLIYGRSEYIYERYPKQFGVEPATSGKTYWSAENGPEQDASVNFTRTSPGKTYRYTYVRDLPAYWQDAESPYSEAGVNECGVSADGTVTVVGNQAIADVDPLVDTGLGEYCVIDIVLSEASTAREGVELLGSIVDEQGSHELNHIWIADANETWTFHQLSGHQWIALRATSNEVSVDPNFGGLRYLIDLDDEEVCRHSQGLEQVAQDAGTAVYSKSGRFDVARSYSLETADESASALTRYVQAHLFLGAPLEGGTSYEFGDDGTVADVADPQLFVAPAHRDYQLIDVMHLLGTRGEGTLVDANANESLPAVGNNNTVECHLFQVHRGMAPQIATVEWLALSSGEFTLYIPSYAALLTEVDASLYPDEDSFDLAHTSFVAAAAKGEEQALTEAEGEALNLVLMDIHTLASTYREQAGPGVHAYLDAVQLQLIDQQAQVDRMMRAAADDQVRTQLANNAHALMSRQAYDRASTLLGELREYVTAADFSVPFAPSGLNEAGQLEEPLTVVAKLQAMPGTSQVAAEVQADETNQGWRPTGGVKALLMMLCGGVTTAAIMAALTLRKVRRNL